MAPDQGMTPDQGVEPGFRSVSWLHPALDLPPHPLSLMPGAGLLRCFCARAPLELSVTAKADIPHLSAAPGLWRQNGALLSFVAVVPSTALQAHRNGDKLEFCQRVGPFQPFGCRTCKVHLGAHVAEGTHVCAGKSLIHIEFGEVYKDVSPLAAIDLFGLETRGVPEKVAQKVRAQLEVRWMPWSWK